MDCVIGKSTHYTFYLGNVSFYYGGCAKICGRRHHISIKVCALLFKYFLLRYNIFGSPHLVQAETKGFVKEYYF